MQPAAYVCVVTICTHTKQIQAAHILYACVQFVHILHMCTLHVCCVERNICAAHILRLFIFVRVTIGFPIVNRQLYFDRL